MCKPEIELTARKPTSDGSGWVDFNPATAFGRAALAHGRIRPSSLGYVYASFGNAGTIQPYHGWVFEIDLDRWKSAGADAAITSSLLVTPETDCGVEGKSGAYEMICGGGVWTPAGPSDASLGSGCSSPDGGSSGPDEVSSVEGASPRSPASR